MAGVSQNVKWLALVRKITIFYSFSFQIIVSVKISAGLLQNLCRNLDEKLVSDQSIGLKEMFQCWMRSIVDKISVSLCSRSFLRHCSARFKGCALRKTEESPVLWICEIQVGEVWDIIIENGVCAAIVHSFRKPRTAFESIYTNTFLSPVSHSLVKPSPKLPGQGNLRLELTVNIEFVLCKPWPIFSEYKQPCCLVLEYCKPSALSPGLIQLCNGFKKGF